MLRSQYFKQYRLAKPNTAIKKPSLKLGFGYLSNQSFIIYRATQQRLSLK